MYQKKVAVRLNNKLYKTAIRPIVGMVASVRHYKEQNAKG